MEHLNCTAKDALGQHSCFNPKSVSRVGRCVGLFQNAQRQFDCVTAVHHAGGGHCHVPATTDVTKIIKQLVENKVFQKRENRSHRSYTMKRLTDGINQERFKDWLEAHIRKIQLQYRAHTANM
jgi:hypothetical protein